jgi:phage shock protein PspC (stress-responsive transcriptional regulator)
MLDDDERPEDAGPAGDAAAPAAEPAGLHPERSRVGSAARDPALTDPIATIDPARYVLTDEPVAAGAPVDYRYLYGLIATQVDREDARGRALDTKIATLLAGVVAGIGFSFRATPTVVTSAAAFLYVVPFCLIASAYTTKLTQDAPKPGAIAASFPAYPVSTLTSSISAMLTAYAESRTLHSVKAARFDFAFLATIIVTAIVLAAQLYTAWSPPHEQHAAAQQQPAVVATASPRPARTPAAKRLPRTHP